MANQQKNDINRFEFLELLVRIAGCKYKGQGSCNTYSQALRQIIDQINLHYTPYPIQMFRDQLLWTRDVNLILDANRKPI